MEVDITVNKLIFDYDLLLIVGPVFPHEVVGFSGGNKYLFPGIAGQEIINFFHWLGAVITNPVIIGNKWTPVRKVVDRAAAMLTDAEVALLPWWCKGEGLAGPLLRHAGGGLVRRPPTSPTSCTSPTWTGPSTPCSPARRRCTTTSGPAASACTSWSRWWPTAATLIIYAPHVTEVSATHGHILEQIGYHTRDYFLKQWDKFQQVPLGRAGALHAREGHRHATRTASRSRASTSSSPRRSRRRCARRSTWATWIRRASTRRTTRTARPKACCYVPKAGEMLYRLRERAEGVRRLRGGVSS